MKRQVFAVVAFLLLVMALASGVLAAPAAKVPAVKSISTFPMVEGVLFRPRMAGDWVMALENEDGKACQSKQKALYAHNVVTGSARMAFETPCGWPESSGDWAAWTANPSLIDKYLSSNGYTRIGPSGGGVVLVNPKDWTYCTPVLPTPSANWLRLNGRYLSWAYGLDAYVADLVTGEWKKAPNPGGGAAMGPVATGSIVACHKRSDTGTQLHIYDVATGGETVISEPGTDLLWPVTDGKTVVYWQTKSKTPGIWAYDLKTQAKRRIADGSCPQIEQGIVVYYKHPTNFIVGFDLLTNTEFKISKAPSNDGPTINHGRVIWGWDNKIHVAELDLPGRPKLDDPLPSPSTWKLLNQPNRVVAKQSKPKPEVPKTRKPVVAKTPTTEVAKPVPPTVTRVYRLPATDGVPFRPRIAGDWVIAVLNEDGNGYESRQRATYAYNLATGEERAPFDVPCSWPDTSADWAAWTADSKLIDTFISGNGHKRIGLNGGSSVLLNTTDWAYCTPILPTPKAEGLTIGGKYLAWSCDNRVYLGDLATGTCRRISANEQVGYWPSVAGGVVTWEELVGQRRRIHIYDITAGTDVVVSDPRFDVVEPRTDGKTVVYWQYDDATSTVWAYDMSKRTTRRIAEGSVPSIDQGIVAYCKDRTNLAYGFDLASGTDFRISADKIDCAPTINNARVVWTQGTAICVAELSVAGKPKSKAPSPAYHNWRMTLREAK